MFLQKYNHLQPSDAADFSMVDAILNQVRYFIPKLGSRGPQWGPVELKCLYVYLYLYLLGHPHLFLAKICVDRNSAQRMRP